MIVSLVREGFSLFKALSYLILWLLSVEIYDKKSNNNAEDKL